MKKLLVPIVVATLGLLSLRSSKANTIDLDVMAQPSTGATGTYHVTLTTTDNTSFSVKVKGNFDGNKTDPDGSGPQKIKHAVGTLAFTFTDSSGTVIGGAGGAGSTTSGSEVGFVGVSPPQTYTGGVWLPLTDNMSFSDKFVSLLTANKLSAFGANEFDGTFSILSAATKVDFSFQNDEQFFANDILLTGPDAVPPATPEASSLALLLPGLIPIGIAMRRRRKARA